MKRCGSSLVVIVLFLLPLTVGSLRTPRSNRAEIEEVDYEVHGLTKTKLERLYAIEVYEGVGVVTDIDDEGRAIEAATTRAFGNLTRQIEVTVERDTTVLSCHLGS